MVYLRIKSQCTSEYLQIFYYDKFLDPIIYNLTIQNYTQFLSFKSSICNYLNKHKKTSIFKKLKIMYEIWIIVFCFLRSIVMKFFLKKKPTLQPQDQQASSKKESPQNKQKPQSAEQVQLKQLKSRKQEIESTIQQYNNPSTFAKYSKMQRQISKLNNQIQNLEEQISKQKVGKQSTENESQEGTSRPTLLEHRKKQAQNIHSQIANKDMLIKALINLALIIGCSYVESSQIPLCAGYPLYAFCNERGRINGAWIFVFSSIIFSY